MKEDAKKKLFLIFPLISGVLWGSTGSFVRVLTAAGIDSRTLLFARGLFGIIIMFVVMLILDKKLLKIRLKDIWMFLGAGILGTMALNLCYNESINRLTLSLAAVLLAMGPVFVVFLAAIFFKEKITGRKIGCLALSIMGCILVSGVIEQAAGHSWSAFGIGIGILSAVFYAIYNLFTKNALDKGYHSFTITFYGFLFMTIVILPMSHPVQLVQYVQMASGKAWIMLIMHSVCTAVLPYLLYSTGLMYAEAGKAAIFSAGGEPVAAMVFGLLLFTEVPTPLMVVGMALVILALTVLSLKKKAAKE